MPSSGLDGVSTQMSFVCGRTASRTACTSVVSATDQVTPQRSTTFEKSRKVPP
jgi:hypothetical protein